MSKLLASVLVATCGILLAACGETARPGAFVVALVDLDGHARVLGSLPESVFAPRVSPDGKQLAFELEDAPNASGYATERVWIAPLENLARRRALPLVGMGRNWAPLWTPDGERVVFLVSGSERDVLYVRRADGTGDAKRLLYGLSAESMTTNGRELSFITLAGDRDYGISLLDMTTRVPAVFADRPGSEQHSSTIASNNRWIAYASNETGAHEIWVEPLPQSGERLRVTQGGGGHPVWSPDGTSLYFDRGARLYRIAFRETAEGPQVGEAEAMPISGFQQGYRRRQYDVMPDGRHFLMLYPQGALH
jgi:Tol biopolymer transport system component